MNPFVWGIPNARNGGAFVWGIPNSEGTELAKKNYVIKEMENVRDQIGDHIWPEYHEQFYSISLRILQCKGGPNDFEA